LYRFFHHLHAFKKVSEASGDAPLTKNILFLEYADIVHIHILREGFNQ